jgi:glutathione S-transferase
VLAPYAIAGAVLLYLTRRAMRESAIPDELTHGRTTMYRLYYSPGSCAMAAHIALEEIGAPYELELISSRGQGKATATPEYKAINPKGRVPALLGVPGRIGGAENLLTELHAILVYLARTNTAAALLPEDPAAEARCIEWMNWLASNVHTMSYGQIWQTQRFVADEKEFPAVKAKGEQNVREQYTYIESLLADGRDWAVPSGYTVVDAYLLVFYHWGRRIGLDMPALYPAWTRITKRVAARPAVARVLAHEGIQGF